MSSKHGNTEERMAKTINVLKGDLAGVRTGRANPAILDKLTVDYYGMQTPLSQVGNISVPEARTILIQPWESSMLKEVEKAIQKSDIGVNPTNDGKVIRLSFPQLTEERRKMLTKEAEKKGEESKVAIRSIRRDAIEEVKEQKKVGEVTEDDLKDSEKQIQNITDMYIAEVDRIVDMKSKEIMEV